MPEQRIKLVHLFTTAARTLLVVALMWSFCVPALSCQPVSAADVEACTHHAMTMSLDAADQPHTLKHFLLEADEADPHDCCVHLPVSGNEHPLANANFRDHDVELQYLIPPLQLLAVMAWNLDESMAGPAPDFHETALQSSDPMRSLRITRLLI